MPCRTPRARPCATSFRASICRYGLARATTAFPLVITRRTTSAVASLFTSQSYGRSATLTLQATHEKTLQHVPLETLMAYAIDADEAIAEKERLDGMRSVLEKGLSGL